MLSWMPFQPSALKNSSLPPPTADTSPTLISGARLTMGVGPTVGPEDTGGFVTTDAGISPGTDASEAFTRLARRIPPVAINPTSPTPTTIEAHTQPGTCFLGAGGAITCRSGSAASVGEGALLACWG